jgi:hypothetical protein
VLSAVLYVLLSLVQAAQTGIVVGVVKLPDGGRLSEPARIVLLPPTYVEIWDKQVQTRLDNYWELFKPEFAGNKEHFVDYNRIVQLEAFRYVTSNMRRDLGLEASRLMKDAGPNGQFEFKDIPFGTYLLLVYTSRNGQELIWSKAVEINSPIPIFVDIGKPVS